MSKSNATEIIAVLWLIASRLQPHGFWHWVFLVLAIENILESIGWSIAEHKKNDNPTASS